MKTIFSPIYLTASLFVMLWQKSRFLRYSLNFSSCRFYPSCSDYFLKSIKKHGLFYGLVLSVKRIMKCHPLCAGGIDELPEVYGR